jgi:hypothetical protein
MAVARGTTKITAILAATAAATALAAGLTACKVAAAKAAAGVSTTKPATRHLATPASPNASAQQPPAQASAKAPAAAKMTAAQTATMNRWYSGGTVTQVANVCADVNQVWSDNVQVSSGTGSSRLTGDITKLQTDIGAALSDPPPVAADAAIWKGILNAYSNAAGGPTNAGLFAAARSARHAVWKWTPSFGSMPLVCLNTSI